MTKRITVTRRQVEAAQFVIEIKEAMGLPVDPAVRQIAEAKPDRRNHS
jgi:hypothetical protein